MEGAWHLRLATFTDFELLNALLFKGNAYQATATCPHRDIVALLRMPAIMLGKGIPKVAQIKNYDL